MRLHHVMAGWALMLVAAAPAPAAGPFGGNLQFRPYAQQQRPRPEPQRDADRRQPQPQRDAGQNERGRLSPEERQKLRRDIHDAGKDLYRGQGPGQRQRRGQ